jgi:hypothetical protein
MAYIFFKMINKTLLNKFSSNYRLFISKMYEISEDLNPISMKFKPGPQFHTNGPVSSTDVQINAPSRGS